MRDRPLAQAHQCYVIRTLPLLWFTEHKMYKLNPLNAELNPICHLLALVGAHHILHISRVRVKNESIYSFHNFLENPPIFTKLHWRSFLLHFPLPFSFSRFIPLKYLEISSVVNWNSVLYSLNQTVHIIRLILALLQFQSHNDFSFSRCWFAWVLRLMTAYANTGRGKEWTETCIAVRSAIWDQRQMSFLLCGFLHDSFELYLHTCVYLQLKTQCNKRDRPEDDIAGIAESEGVGSLESRIASQCI